MNPFKDAKEAIEYIDNFNGNASHMNLPISDSLQDSLGINMSLITDKIFDKGWEPNGYEIKEGFRIYHYKKPE